MTRLSSQRHQSNFITGRTNLPSVMVWLVLAGCVTGLVGCSDFNKAIGKQKSAPDEFEVVVRPPLSLPPQFAVRPSDDTVSQTAASTSSANAQASSLLKSRNTDASGYNQVFNLDAIEEDIRVKVDEETVGIQTERRLPLQIIFGGVPNVGPVLNQMEEDARIRRNKLQNKPITEGKTPAIDGVLGDPVSIE